VITNDKVVKLLCRKERGRLQQDRLLVTEQLCITFVRLQESIS